MADGLSGLSLDSVQGAYSKYSGTTVSTDSEDESSYLDFDSYLKIMVAQMQNQDFNNPMSDSEMLQQMSSYSMLEGIKNMTAQANISYATSLVGKAVTVNDGTQYDTGLVESVVVEDNTPYLMVNGGRYEASKVSDITSPDIYSALSKLIGQTVDAKITDEDGKSTTATGEVTNVLILSGTGFVVVDGKNIYPLSDVTVQKSETNTEENTDTNTSENSVNAVAYAAADNTQSGYAAQSMALFDELMSTIDAISNSSTKVESVQGVLPDVTGYDTVTIQRIEVPDYAAGVFAETDQILQTLSINPIETMSSLQSNGRYDANLDTSNINSVIAQTRDGRISSVLSNDEVNTILNDSDYETRYSTRYGLEVKSDTLPGISISDCVPHRRQLEGFDDELALADALGTRMYDVRYIHNTDITSRIDTSEVIGTTLSGKQVTEIGFSGKGRLGEVVTFADGRQRVEVILTGGTSSWIYTSGNYTLDEMCDFTGAPGSLAGKLTAEESAIRHYSREYSDSQQAYLNSMEKYFNSVGVKTVTT